MADQNQDNQDQAWLARLLTGDHQTFAQFVDKYKETVFLCCRTLGLKDDEAEDVASETFLAAYKGLKKFKGKSQLSTWLWTIAYRQGINYLRKNQIRCRLLAELDQQLADSREQAPAEALQNKETEKIVWQAVKKLPRLWAVAVILHYREEKKVIDIAKIMQVKENTAKTYLFRGRERLKLTLPPLWG